MQTGLLVQSKKDGAEQAEAVAPTEVAELAKFGSLHMQACPIEEGVELIPRPYSDN